MNFKKPLKITSRTSTVTNSFVQAIVPSIAPDKAEHQKVLAILGIDPSHVVCAYCGDAAHHWDHLNPYVSAKRPSGFLNEARNLVPSCGLCNTSKSGQPWRKWITGKAKASPQSRGVSDITDRIGRLELLEAHFGLLPIDFSSMVDADLWKRYWDRLDQIELLMFEAQADAELINAQIASSLQR